MRPIDFPILILVFYWKYLKKFPNDYTLQFTENMPKSIMKKNIVIYEIKLMSKDWDFETERYENVAVCLVNPPVPNFIIKMSAGLRLISLNKILLMTALGIL